MKIAADPLLRMGRPSAACPADKWLGKEVWHLLGMFVRLQAPPAAAEVFAAASKIYKQSLS